jgi:hypothetical protein
MFYEAGVPSVIRKAVQLRNSGRALEAAHVLDEYSAACVDKVLAKLHHLLEQLESPFLSTTAARPFVRP